MGLINGNFVSLDTVVVPRYRWVNLINGYVSSKVPTIVVDNVNGEHRNLYGVAVKYIAPQRSDGLKNSIYVQLMNMDHSNPNSPYVKYVAYSNQMMEATSNSSKKHGQIIIDGTYGLYKGYWFVGNGNPIADHSTQNIHPLPFTIGCMPSGDDNINAVRLICQLAEDENGFTIGGFDEGTTYEIWGLVKEVDN